MNYEIPLISKTPEYIGLPEFYDSAKGIEIKIDGKKYLDFSVIGASACILGYADKYVNYHVKKCINKGNFSSLNSRYMNKLTSLLLSIHKNQEMIRYCKCGGEALDLALDLAIEKIKNNKLYILSVGYNGWKIKNKKYSNIDVIDEILKLNIRPDIIIFELIRHKYPKLETIEKLNKWQKEGTTLIIDEITTGFRFCSGGVHQKYDLNPDMIVYGKGISNGYPFSCIIGKEKIMKSDLWISSTYWTDSIGFVAAYYTLKKLLRCKYYLLDKLGKSIKTIWIKAANYYDLKIKCGDVNNIINFDFDYEKEKSLLMKSYFIELMQKENFLALNQFYPTFSHKIIHVIKYSRAIYNVFKQIKKDINVLEDIIIKELKEIRK